MTREQALRLVVSAARKVSETHQDNYPIHGQYERVLADRLLRLRRAIKDFDEAEDGDGEEDTGASRKRSRKSPRGDTP